MARLRVRRERHPLNTKRLSHSQAGTTLSIGQAGRLAITLNDAAYADPQQSAEAGHAGRGEAARLVRTGKGFAVEVWYTANGAWVKSPEYFDPSSSKAPELTAERAAALGIPACER